MSEANKIAVLPADLDSIRRTVTDASVEDIADFVWEQELEVLDECMEHAGINFGLIQNASDLSAALHATPQAAATVRLHLAEAVGIADTVSGIPCSVRGLGIVVYGGESYGGEEPFPGWKRVWELSLFVEAVDRYGRGVDDIDGICAESA